MTLKTALVTGGAGGVARALLPLLLEAGYRVALVDIDLAGLARLQEAHGDAVRTLRCDLCDPAQIEQIVAMARGAFGKLDLLVNNAGIITPGPFESIDPTAIAREVELNLLAPMRMIRAALPWMNRPGAIVNLISMAGIVPMKDSAAYSAGKFGLRGFSIALATELKPQHIRVSSILPAAIDTPMLERETRGGGSALNFLSEPLTPDAVAATIMRAAREGKLEYCLPKSDGVSGRLALVFPSIIPWIIPKLERRAVAAQRAWLARKDALRAASSQEAR